MPKKTVDAAVTRGGADKTAGAGLEELVYEGTLPGGVGVIVDALSDNKNRTAGEVRATFKKHGGALGAPGSVARCRATAASIVCHARAACGEVEPSACASAGSLTTSKRRRCTFGCTRCPLRVTQ